MPFENTTDCQAPEDTSRKAWTTPEIKTNEVFTKAALSCCLESDGVTETGSTGVNAPCP